MISLGEVMTQRLAAAGARAGTAAYSAQLDAGGGCYNQRLVGGESPGAAGSRQVAANYPLSIINHQSQVPTLLYSGNIGIGQDIGKGA